MSRAATFRTLAVLSALLTSSVASAAPRVEIEVFFAPSLSANSQAQKWTKALEDAGIGSVRFRSIENGDKVSLKTDGEGDKIVYHVKAQLSSKGDLVTPGGPFNLGDATKLKKWIGDLAASGGPNAPRKTLFGLTTKQFDEVNRALTATVAGPTKGQRPEKVIEQIRSALALPLVIEPAMQQAIAADDPVRDELQGLSAGTVLAALVRPAGAVLLPHVGANGIELTVVNPGAKADMWPIGWPPAEKDETKLLPALFQFIPVDIDGAPASEAITALQDRLKIPMVFDYNNLVRQKVDLKKPLKLPVEKTFYRKILDRVLFQVGLKAEVRLDDAGKPFLWITTV